jgi:hypothetical protein
MMKKSKKIQSPKRKVYSFVVDGECELWYLQLMKQNKTATINLEPKIPQKKKLDDQYKLVVELSKESEKVFWIIDFDTISKETKEAKRGSKTPLQKFRELYERNNKKNEKIIIIVNNPCLEYWFLQHFEQTSKYYATYATLEEPLKKHLPYYEKSEKYYKNSRQNIYQKLNPSLPTAISNSQKLGEFTFQNTHTGVTEMYKVFESIADAGKILSS